MLPEIDLNGLLTRTEAANLAGVAVCTVSNWVARGHLKQAIDDNEEPIVDGNGRPMYRTLDVARAELATREKARRYFSTAEAA